MKKKQENKSIFVKVFRIVKNTLFWTVVAILIVIIGSTFFSRITGSTPSIFGYSVFRVSSQSMEPELELGEVILVKECSSSDVSKGDIVTFQGKKASLNGKIITHRVVEAPYEYQGEIYIKTKGDANDLTDPQVNFQNVIGKFVMTLPFLTWFYSIMLSPYGIILLVALVVIVFIEDIIVFFRKKSKNSQGD